MGIVDKLRGSVRAAAERVRRCGWHRLFVSAMCAVGLLGLGLIQNLLGPTQLDIASHIRVQLNEMAPMFSIRGIGDLVASVTLGFLLDRFENWTYKLLYVTFGWAIWVTAVQPLSYNLVSLAVMMCLFGVGNGAVDIGVHVVLMKLWQDESGPFLIMADFAFTLGAFAAPLLAQPFLLDADSMTWPCATISTVFDQGDYSWECQRAVNVSCTPFEGRWNATVSHRVLMQHSCIHDLLQNENTSYHLAYWIAVVPWLLCHVAFLYVGLTREKCPVGECLSKKLNGLCPVEDKVMCTTEEEVLVESPSASLPRGVDFKHYPSAPVPRRVLVYRASLYVTLFFFVMAFNGLLVTFGNLVFTFAVEGPGFSKVEATDLNSLFWGAYTFSRVVSIFLILTKAPPLLMIAANVFGSFLSLLPMVLVPNSPTVVWVGMAALGASMTSVFPTTLTWLAQQVEITGKVTAVMVAGAALGDMVMPAIAEEIMARTSARALLYFGLADVGVAGFLVGVLFALSYLCNRKIELSVQRKDECKKLTDEDDSETEKCLRHRWTAADESS